MEKRIFDLRIASVPKTLLAFTPFPPAKNRAAWEGIEKELKAEIEREGELGLDFFLNGGTWPTLYASQYLDFSKTGNRTRFEDCYFKRRNMLITFVLCECVEHSGRFIPHIIDGIFLLCEESSWCLPAHNSYVRDTPQLALPISSRPVLDLFAAETGALLSTIFYLLKSELDSESEIICSRIQEEINSRIINPYLNEHFWWMGCGTEEMCNWTAWCTQNVLFASFLTPQTESTRQKILRKAFYSLDCFLKDYGEDGCCSEGVEYYRHASLCLFNATNLICKVTGSALTGIWQEEKIKNMAEYILNMHVPQSDFYFNFADCLPNAGRAGAREFLFGKKIKSSLLCNFALEDLKKSTAKEKLCGISFESKSGHNLFYIVQSIFCISEISNIKEEKISVYKNSHWYESIGIFIQHTELFSLAVKAGGNGDSHNHNDTGSFILYKNKKPFVIDVGVESYTKKTFSSERYDIWTMQSAWHNLPTFCGVMQSAGSNFCAKDVQVKEASISMDIANAYPKSCNVKSYKRTATQENDFVRIEDSVFWADNKNSCVELSLLFSEKPILKSDFFEVENTGRVEFESKTEKPKFFVEEVLISDFHLQSAWGKKIYRVILTFKDNLVLKFF